MSKPLDVLIDYVERSTHWREGGATRHDALQALRELVAAERDACEAAYVNGAEMARRLLRLQLGLSVPGDHQ